VLFHVLFMLLNITKTINIFLAHFRFLKKLQIFLMLLGIMHVAPHLPKSPLTLLELPAFGYFHKKNSSFWLPYQRPSSSAHCARELFSGSNGSASLVDCTQTKNFLLGGCSFFVSDVISGGLGPLCLALGANR